MNRYSAKRLDPCPFCGGEPEIVESLGKVTWWIQCPKCHIEQGYGFYELDEAVEQWNTRKED